jgi:hypothetical protein
MSHMAQDPELAGHVLGGKYRLVRSVSDGPLKVYEARHERLSGRFAVTLWPATTPWDAFRRGAELAVTLRHPGVVQVLDFNCEPGASPFLVLEWIDGERLSDLIAESGLLPIQRVAPLIESAAWALASAHQQGIVHQELRPTDIFIVHAAGTMREWVKLGGFGVSAALARARTAPPSRYHAPEQVAGARAVAVDALEEGSELDNDEADPQSDQYALAAIAYEMLAGVPPFDEERSQAEPLPISDLAPGVSPAVDAAIRQALAAEPEQRFAGVLEFARALRAAADGASPETVRRWRLEGGGDGAGASGRSRRRGKNGEAVSPFFNPLQSAGEAFRRVATTTARLRTLAGARLTKSARLPGSSTRIALASGALLLAFSGAAVVMKRSPRRPAAAVAPTTPVASARAASSSPAPPAAAPPRAPDPEVTPVAEVPTVPAPPVAEVRPATVPAKDEGGKPKTIEAEPAKGNDARAAAWARLASTGGARSRGVGGRGAAAPAPKVAAAHPKPAVVKPAVVKPAVAKPAVAKSAVGHPAAASSAGSGPCVLTVGSKPLADVWIDERSLGRRTPVVGYHLACGDHKLVLKRSDLDIYQMEIITLRPGAPFKKVYPLQ